MKSLVPEFYRVNQGSAAAADANGGFAGMGTDATPTPPDGQLLIYEDGALNIQVRLDGQTVWLTQAAMSELFQTTPQNITIHLINESLSDVWGEFIDLSYGTENAAHAWLIGEGSSLGILRDMDEPHSYDQPEVYLESGYWYNGISSALFVHTNSGVGNKLCHLIVKGDSDFRGSSYTALASVQSQSILATAKLYYEVQANRLTSGADYYDLAWALSDSASDAATDVIDLGNDIDWNAAALAKVVYAIVAVEIW